MIKRVRSITVNDKMQRSYTYTLTAPAGRNFDAEFRPELTPKEMLALGVFGGKYMTDCRNEFPASWFARAKLSPGRANLRRCFPPCLFVKGSAVSGSFSAARISRILPSRGGIAGARVNSSTGDHTTRASGHLARSA